MLLPLFLYLRPLALLSLALLAGCVTQPAVKPSSNVALLTQHLATLAQLDHYTLKGRLGVNANGKGFSGGITWQHQPSTDTIELFTPLGSKAAAIKKTPTEVALTTSDNKVMKADNAEALTEKTLGWRLPLAGLSDWALGKPTKSPIESSTWDEQGRLLTLTQDGWQIAYEHYSTQAGTSLPGKVTLKNNRLNLKLLIEQWQLNSAQNK